jgi:hypothetical protein
MTGALMRPLSLTKARLQKRFNKFLKNVKKRTKKMSGVMLYKLKLILRAVDITIATQAPKSYISKEREQWLVARSVSRCS